MTETTERFYATLTPFSRFEGILDENNYRQAPRDWWVVVTDIKNSTEAIGAGRYKDVNTVGAATIAAIQNAMGEIPFPFVFGGDGAKALIPQHKKDEVELELNALRTIAENNFQLGLRVGMVSVAELEEEDLHVKVAKYALQSLYPLAMFRGGALTRAEDKIKDDPAKYEVPVHQSKDTDLSKLSCRWQPLPTQNGRIMALLVVATTKNTDETYSVFINRLSEILDGQFDRANPVKTNVMRYQPLFAMLVSEARFQTNRLRLIPRIVETMISSLLFGVGLFRAFGFFRNYVDATPSHSDFRKFDDMLRMVLDCSEVQSQAIQVLCDDLYAQGAICYGIHFSDQALMTCYLPGMKDGEHIHFIDGGDGGYAIASKQLKTQLKSAKG